MRELFSKIIAGKTEPEQAKNFLLSLRGKEDSEMIFEAAGALRSVMVKIDVRDYSDEVVLDNCGTGGSAVSTFNISTAAAFVIAGVGIKVAKHGNRGVSSRFGSSDVIQDLGINFFVSPERMEKIIKEVGIGFLFAPLYHPAMKHVAEIRREISGSTIFNILGPLCNPAGADVQVVGVSEERLLNIIPQALKSLGAKRAFVVFGMKGVDELSIEGETLIAELNNGEILPLRKSSPSNFGIRESPLGNILPGKNSKENSEIIMDVLRGKKSARADAVLINAALGIIAAGKASEPKIAAEIARDSILSGKALKKLENLIKFSKEG